MHNVLYRCFTYVLQIWDFKVEQYLAFLIVRKAPQRTHQDLWNVQKHIA